MEFSVLDRIILLNVLPQQGDILTLRAARKFREALTFSDEEMRDFELLQTADSVTGKDNYRWNRATEKPKEVEIGKTANDMIAKALSGLSDAGRLTNEHLSLCDRFIPPPAALELVEKEG